MFPARLGVPLLAVLFVLIAIGAGAREHLPHLKLRARTSHTAASNRQAAGTTAAGLLHDVVLPSGAQRSRSDPSVGARLAVPADRLGTPDLIDTHQFWTVPGRPRQVLAGITADRPAGSQVTSTARGAVNGKAVTWSAAFGLPPIPGVIMWRELAVTVAAARGGETAVRADGEAAWLIPRSPGEHIAPNVGTIDIATGTLLGGQTRTHTSTVTTPRRVGRIVALFNTLPAQQPGIGGCTLDRGVRVRYTFEAASSGLPLAVALVDPACGTIALTLDGRPQPALAVSVPGQARPIDARRLRALVTGSL